MIKKLCKIILFICFYIIISSKPLYPAEFTFNWGVKVGYGFSSSIIDNHSSSSSSLFDKGSLTGGGYFHFSHVDFVRLQFEVLYIQKGFNRPGYSANFHCISFPILVRFQLPMEFFINTGFAISFIAGGSVNDSSYSSTDIDDHVDRLDYDLVFGFGWGLDVYKGSLIFLELRFTYALLNTSLRYPQTSNNYSTHVFIGFQY